MLLSSEQIQALVRSKKFQFDAVADSIKAQNGANVSSDKIRLAFSNKESLEVERPCSPLEMSSDTIGSPFVMADHKSRCNAAFLRAAAAMAGGEIIELGDSGPKEDKTNPCEGAPPTTPNSKEQDDVFLASNAID